MTVFGAIGIASTGLTTYRKWIDHAGSHVAVDDLADVVGPGR